MRRSHSRSPMRTQERRTDRRRAGSSGPASTARGSAGTTGAASGPAAATRGRAMPSDRHQAPSSTVGVGPRRSRQRRVGETNWTDSDEEDDGQDQPADDALRPERVAVAPNGTTSARRRAPPRHVARPPPPPFDDGPRSAGRPGDDAALVDATAPPPEAREKMMPFWLEHERLAEPAVVRSRRRRRARLGPHRTSAWAMNGFR